MLFLKTSLLHVLCICSFCLFAKAFRAPAYQELVLGCSGEQNRQSPSGDGQVGSDSKPAGALAISGNSVTMVLSNRTGWSV